MQRAELVVEDRLADDVQGHGVQLILQVHGVVFVRPLGIELVREVGGRTKTTP